MSRYFLIAIICIFTLNAFSQSEADKIFREAKTHLLNKKWDKAHQLLSYLIKDNKNEHTYYHLRAISRVGMLRINAANNDWKKAISIVEQKIKQDPSNCFYYEFLAKSQFRLGIYTKSQLNYNKSLELCSNDSIKTNIYYSLGLIHSINEKYRKSIENFDLAQNLDETFESVYFQRAYSKINFGDKVCGCDDWIVYKSMTKDTLFPKYSTEKAIDDKCSDYMNMTKPYWNKIALKVKNTTPEYSKLRMDSIEISVKFYKDNMGNISEMVDSIRTVPINLCLNEHYQFRLNVDKEGDLTLKSIVRGSPNPVMNNLIIAKLNGTNLKWKPRIVDGEAQDFTWVLKYRFVKGLSVKRHNRMYRGYYGRQPLDISRHYDGTNENRCAENEKHYQLGVQYYLDKKFRMAKLSFETALEYNISDLDSHYNLGMTLLKLDKKEKACDCFKANMKLGDKASYNQFNSNCKN